MELSIATPALLFSAQSLLMLAYTQRLLALYKTIRDLASLCEKGCDLLVLKQIDVLRKRVELIKYMQASGAMSILVAVVSMGFIQADREFEGVVAFYTSLILLAMSLVCSLREILISDLAINYELDRLKGFEKSRVK